MADLTTHPHAADGAPAPSTRTEDRRSRIFVAAGLVGGLVALAVIRIWFLGWAPLAPDDARYLFVGLSILDGQGAVNPSGAPYLLRSPVYGLTLALGSQAVGGDPLVGARIVAATAALLGLLGAMRLGWLAAGPGGAVGTAVALVATPLLWRLLPSLRIDLPQTALVIALLLAAWHPTVRRWAAAGVLLGLVVLVKETALPLLALPVALIGLVPFGDVRRVTLAYVGAAIATAAWWWVVVWAGTGQVFPANALAVIEARDVTSAIRLGVSAVPLVGAIVVAWVVVAWRARHELGPRLVLAAGILLAPAAIYAASQGLNARNFAGLAVISSIAVGIAGATLVAAGRPRLAGSAGAPLRAATAIGLVVVLGFALVGPVVGQRGASSFPADRLTRDLVDWLDEHTATGGRIVMAFREREEIALRRFGRTDVGILPIARVRATDPLDEYLWMGLRDDQLFGYRRAAWARALTEPPATHLVLVRPHPFTPTDLVDAAGDVTAPSFPGLVPVASLDDGEDHADIFRLEPAAALATTAETPLHLDAAAALAWLDLAGEPGAEDRLLETRPVVSGNAELLIERLGDRACTIREPSGATVLAPAGSCPG